MVQAWGHALQMESFRLTRAMNEIADKESRKSFMIKTVLFISMVLFDTTSLSGMFLRIRAERLTVISAEECLLAERWNTFYGQGHTNCVQILNFTRVQIVILGGMRAARLVALGAGPCARAELARWSISNAG